MNRGVLRNDGNNQESENKVPRRFRDRAGLNCLMENEVKDKSEE